MSAQKDGSSVIRIKPYFYIHVLDNNTNVTRVEVGHQTFTRQEHEKVVFGPEEMIKIPPRNYVVISNPIVRDAKKQPQFDTSGSPKLRFGDEEIRFEDTLGEPFPLYPGEVLNGKISPLPLVGPSNALRLRALRDTVDRLGVKRKAGDEWIFEGPNTYYPQVEVLVVESLVATIIKENEAIRLRAKKQTTDKSGKPRKTGEEWLVRESGAYMLGVDEEVVEIGGKSVVKAVVLTDKKALHLRALKSFTDIYGHNRKAGEEWLVTIADSSTHIPDVYEEVVTEVKITTLTNRQYCVVIDPVGPDGNNQMGREELRVGECSFFLRPNEKLKKGIQQIYVLGEEEALLLSTRSVIKDPTSKDGIRRPGDRWMIHGPTDYVPPVEVDIIERRKLIPLDENEGIYVRDMKTGKVRAVHGVSYMLQPHEELWEKQVPPIVEELLLKAGTDRFGNQLPKAQAARDKTRVVTFRAPHNSAVQIYDYKEKKSRVVFGPELVMLAPEEQFTVITLSGGTPKKSDQIKSLCLLLGPDFMTDVVTVETSDHARLALQLAYNWNFAVDKKNPEEAAKIFQVPDFVGDACKAIASRVRGSVAATTFDNFHRCSSTIIRMAVFGKDSETGEPRANLVFKANHLMITGIDIQSVEPVDERTRDSLQKSVQLAIEITTKSQEASARHEAQRIEQEAKGLLEIQRINNEIEAEKDRKELLALQAKSANVEATGHAIAEARAKADALEIEAQAAVEQSRLRAEAARIQATSELEQLTARNQSEVKHQLAVDELEVSKAKDLATIEARKFKNVVSTLGADTIEAMAQAGPELQAKLLQGLGLKSFMITDGNSPINLFNTANGLIGNVSSS
jgi:major vault protein